MARLSHAPHELSSIVSYLIRRPISKNAWSIVQRIVVGAAIYFVWQERNLRLFQGKRRTADVLFKIIIIIIIHNVRLKLIGLKFKNTRQVKEMCDLWEFHANIGASRENFGKRQHYGHSWGTLFGVPLC